MHMQHAGACLDCLSGILDDLFGVDRQMRIASLAQDISGQVLMMSGLSLLVCGGLPP
jgi:hypothetical protein